MRAWPPARWGATLVEGPALTSRLGRLSVWVAAIFIGSATATTAGAAASLNGEEVLAFFIYNTPGVTHEFDIKTFLFPTVEALSAQSPPMEKGLSAEPMISTATKSP
jgi:hypothetical protein